MDLEQARAYVRQHSRAVLCTLRQDGTPQLSPVAAPSTTPAASS